MSTYLDLRGRTIDLSTLDQEELQLFRQLQADAERMDSATYRNHWVSQVSNLLSPRGLSKAAIVRSSLYRLTQDLGSRQQVQRGEARVPDYRDELEGIILDRFKTHRAFCEATGLSEDMLSHVLARRKHLAIDTLTEALGRVGYRLTIAPLSR
jgi:hypothetical protein